MIAAMPRPSTVELRLQARSASSDNAPEWFKFRYARPNGWHCGHWHRTPEDALSCIVSKGVQV